VSGAAYALRRQPDATAMAAAISALTRAAARLRNAARPPKPSSSAAVRTREAAYIGTACIPTKLELYQAQKHEL